jgi:hypothetical protein
MEPSFSTQTSPAPDKLVAGEYPRVRVRVTIAAGQNLQKNSVLGRVTAGGKFVLSASAAADGSQAPVAVLPEAVDATGGDRTADVYLTGEFAKSALVLGAGHTAAAIEWGLTARGIYLRDTVA